MTHTPAPALTSEEARTVAAGEQQEAVARALYENCYGGTWDLSWEEFCETPGADPGYYRRLAAAAIAALPPSPAEEAVKRVEALADAIESEDWGVHNDDTRAKRGTARRFRAALASPAPAPQGEEGR